MLATLTREPFSDPHWLFEAKLDGIRCLAFRKGQRLTLFSRNQLRLNDSFPTLIPPLLKQSAADFFVDVEIVAIENGGSRFSLLQKRMQIHVPVFYYILDLLYIAVYVVTCMD